jgi:DNA adenine methylase
VNFLPRAISHTGVPPIKCQGIKTKLIPFIAESIQWDANKSGRWVEPFLGSGCVAFNIQADNALLCDTNCHIIGLYQAIQKGSITGSGVRAHLESEGKKLSEGGETYYYSVRERFNATGNVLDFLFLNRACFNGLMRFNRKGNFNVPFGHKPERFAPAYITKIVNQINWVTKQMQGRNWEFRVSTWQETLASAKENDFVYLDPPYIGRHADYYSQWSDTEATDLVTATHNLPCGYALSMWLENQYRRNEHVDTHWKDNEMRICSHFYHVGSTESLRNEVEEALLIRKGFATQDTGKKQTRKQVEKPQQMTMFLEALEPTEGYPINL